MARIFLPIYQFLNQGKLRFSIIVLVVMVPLVYLAAQLRLEEDITKMMPDDKKIEKLNDILQSSKFTDRLVFNIYSEDTSVTAEQLIQYADKLVDSLTPLKGELIKDITYSATYDSMTAVYRTIYDYLPLFLDNEDYNTLTLFLYDINMQKVAERNFRTLNSPASGMFSQQVLADPLGLVPLGLKKLQKMQFSDNYEIVDGHVLTKDHRHLLFFVVPAQGSSETGRNTELINSINGYIEGQAKDSLIKAEYFGPVAIAVANANRMKQDIQLTTGIATILLIVGIYYFYRRKSIFLLIFLPVAGGAAFAMAIMFIFKTKVSGIALGISSVLLGVTIDYSLHTITHYKNVKTPRQLISDIATPIMICSLTTMGTLLGLLFVKSEALREMGMFSALNVLGSAIFTITLLPVLLGWGKAKTELHEDTPQMQKLEKWLAFPFHKVKWLNIGIFSLFAICFVFAGKVGFDTDMNSINYMPDNLKLAEDHLDEINNYRLKNIYLVSEGKDLEAALRVNERTEQKIRRLKKQKVVEEYTNISMLLASRDKQCERLDKWEEFWKPERKKYIERSLRENSVALGFRKDAYNGFYEWLNKPFTPATPEELSAVTNLMLSDYISEGPKGVSIVSIIRVEEEHRQEVYDAFEEAEGVVVFDKRYLTTKLLTLIKDDFDLLVTLSFFIVLFILILSYGDLLIAIIVMLPVVISWYFTLGLMALVGLEFNVVNIVISTFLYGVGVDYSVFVMRGLLQDYREGINHLPSYKSSVFVSAFTTIAGVGALFFAVHPALKSIATSVMIGSIAIVVLAFTTVPAVFYWLIRDKHGNLRKYPITMKGIFQTLWFYLMVVVGSIIVPIYGIVVFSLVFIPMKQRKLAFHYAIHTWAKLYIKATFGRSYTILNPHGETFAKPAVIICNHLSLLDTPSMLQLHPKLIILTNDWVRRSPLFGFATRWSDMYSISSGMDAILPALEQKVKDGYSIVVFPEGTRSKTYEVQRFHKGAFYIAGKLQMDIMPLFLQGTGYVLGKTDFWGHHNSATLQINERITPDDKRFGATYSERAKQVRHWYNEQLPPFIQQYEDADYMSVKLKDNYIYKGFKIEWRLAWTLHKEHNFRYLNEVVPLSGHTAVLGSGYGFSANMLSLLHPERHIDAIEADEEKQLLAANGNYRNAQLQFHSLEEVETDKYETIILEDIEGRAADAVDKALEMLKKTGKMLLAGSFYNKYASEVKSAVGAEYAMETVTPVAGYSILIIRRK